MRLLTAGLLLFATSSAAASSTMCMFDPSPAAPVPTLEFLGYERIGPVLVHGAGGPRSLPAGSWKVLAFDERSHQIDFVYTNPGNPSLPPSLTLKGQGRHTRLVVRGQTYTGEFRCGFW